MKIVSVFPHFVKISSPLPGACRFRSFVFFRKTAQNDDFFVWQKKHLSFFMNIEKQLIDLQGDRRAEGVLWICEEDKRGAAKLFRVRLERVGVFFWAFL